MVKKTQKKYSVFIQRKMEKKIPIIENIYVTSRIQLDFFLNCFIFYVPRKKYYICISSETYKLFIKFQSKMFQMARFELVFIRSHF